MEPSETKSTVLPSIPTVRQDFGVPSSNHLDQLVLLLSLSLSLCSDGSYPKDEGSSQEVTQSLFVGESQNRGSNGGQNKYWGLGGADGRWRTLPRNR